MASDESQPTDPGPDPNTPLRMYLALLMLREWGMGQNFHGGVVVTIRDWFDGGRQGPIPWPGGAVFEEWATQKGLSNVDGFVGFRMTMQLTEAASVRSE